MDKFNRHSSYIYDDCFIQSKVWSCIDEKVYGFKHNAFQTPNNKLKFLQAEDDVAV